MSTKHKDIYKEWIIVQNKQNCGRVECKKGCVKDGERTDVRPHGPYLYLSRWVDGHSEMIYCCSGKRISELEAVIDDVNDSRTLTAVPRPKNLGKIVRDMMSNARSAKAN